MTGAIIYSDNPGFPLLPAVRCAGTSSKQLKLDFSQKDNLALTPQGPELFTVEGVLTPAEAAKLAAAAEAVGFQAQGSGGASHGEVSKLPKTLSCPHLPCLWTCGTFRISLAASVAALLPDMAVFLTPRRIVVFNNMYACHAAHSNRRKKSVIPFSSLPTCRD